uniref:Schlafen family member 11 n=1 Tax=Buteo japonicus TaxID=224669 RepID=A0A8C0B291_9AVES
MARQEGQLLINLKTNYPNVVVDVGKIVLGERPGKKTSHNQKRQQKELSIAVCALLNSGGGVVRMESEDKKYCFQEHGIGLDIEQSLGGHLLLFVKTWNCGGPEQRSAATKPRICSLSTGLSHRSFTLVVPMNSSDVAGFLRRKESCAKCHDENGPSAEKALLNFDGGAKETPLNTEECNFQDATARFLKRDKLIVGEVLDFTETTHIEFKNFSTENILEYIRKTLPNYVSAFANTQGGYLFFGVDDSSKVIGSHGKVGKEALEKTVAGTMSSMPIHHFCGSQAGVHFKTYVLSIYDKAEGLQGYVCAVRVELFCCAVCYDNPESWIVTGDMIERVELMTAADPDLADKFENELSLANGPPLIKPVYSKAGLQCASELRECVYPGKPFFLDIFLNLRLYLTELLGRETAYALKQKLVNDGGYASKVCVIPQILHLNGTENQMEVAEDDIFHLYPENYILTSRDIPAFLCALVIVVLCFKFYLSDHLGCEIFNLLTLKQYELLSKNLHKAKDQCVLGVPGTGKTIVALKIIERIRNIFHCSTKEILYICEEVCGVSSNVNDICRSVTHVAFLNGDFPEVKHIVVDEAQNFRPEENWHQCAQELVKKKSGIFWVFLDFFQSTHPYGCGLKFSELYPQEWLTKVVCNAKQIYNVMFNLMEEILQEHNTDMPYEVLEELFKQAECAHSLSGDYIIEKNMGTFEMAEYVTRQCNSYIQQGYPIKDTAILCSTQHAAWVFSQILEPELKRQIRKCRVRLVLGLVENVLEDVIVLDSIQHFSGLERRIVFGIHPVPAQKEISLNLLLCVASRTHTKLHLLYHREKTFLRETSLDDGLLLPGPVDTKMLCSFFVQ